MQLPKYVTWEEVHNTSYIGEGDYEERNYSIEEEILASLFNKKSNNLNDIYHRVTLLDRFYSTNILAGKTRRIISKYIESENLESKILGAPTKEDRIKLVINTCKELKEKLNSANIYYTPYSFFTKYCSLLTFHKNNKVSSYPIFDSEVKNVLHTEYKNTFNFDSIYEFLDYQGNNSLEGYKNYEYLWDTIDSIKNYLEKDIEYKKLDAFMWRRGKEITSIKNENKFLKLLNKNFPDLDIDNIIKNWENVRHESPLYELRDSINLHEKKKELEEIKDDEIFLGEIKKIISEMKTSKEKMLCQYIFFLQQNKKLSELLKPANN